MRRLGIRAARPAARSACVGWLALQAAVALSGTLAWARTLALDVDVLEVLRRGPQCSEEYTPGCAGCCPKEIKEPPVFLEGILRDFSARLTKALARGEVRRLKQTHTRTEIGGVSKIETSLARNLVDPLGFNLGFTIKSFDSTTNQSTAAAFLEAAIPKITRAQGSPPSERFQVNRSALLSANESFAIEMPPEFCEVKVNFTRLDAREDLGFLSKFYKSYEPCHSRRLMIVFSPKMN